VGLAVRGGAPKPDISNADAVKRLLLSEIITEPGVEVVGPLPRDISQPTELIGFLSAHAKDPQAAKALLAYLTGPEAAKVYRERGMQLGR
jgi:hypothetical protein